MINFFSKYVTPIVCLLSFIAGLYAAYAWTSIRDAIQLKEIQNQVIKQEAINRKTVSDLQTVNANQELAYNALKEKLNEIPITNVPCKLSVPAIKLWNQSKGIESKLPTDTSRASEAPTASDTPVATEGIGIKLVLENELANDKICNDMRAQLNGIIKWNTDTFGK